MASLSRMSMIRLNSLIKSRYFSSILLRDYSRELSNEKPQYFDYLIDDEDDPEKILHVCRTAFLHPNGYLDRTSFSNAMSKLKNYKPFNGIPSFLEELKSHSDLQNEQFFSRAIILYGETGFVDHSIKTFQQMKEMGISLSTKTLNSLLLACYLSKKYDEVNRVYHEFPKTYNLKPDLDTYNTVILGLCKTGFSTSVYSILDEMEKNKCKPDTDTFTPILCRFFKEDKLIDVEKVLEIMEKQEDVEIYELRVKSLCRLYRSPEANSLFEEMLSKGMKPTPKIYCYLIRGFCFEGSWDKAERIFDIMPKENRFYDFMTLQLFVNTLVNCFELDVAKEIIQEIKKFEINLARWKEIEETIPEDVSEMWGEEVKENFGEEETLPQLDEAREVIQEIKKFEMNVGMWKETEKTIPEDVSEEDWEEETLPQSSISNATVNKNSPICDESTHSTLEESPISNDQNEEVSSSAIRISPAAECDEYKNSSAVDKNGKQKSEKSLETYSAQQVFLWYSFGSDSGSELESELDSESETFPGVYS